MRTRRLQQTKLGEKISTLVNGEKPLREFAGNISKLARLAINEAKSLSLEQVDIRLERLPKKLDGLKIVHLSDIHHSNLTGLDHIARAVTIASSLQPDLVVLTGDYVSHDAEYIEPVARVMGELKGKIKTFACLGNHDHWTDADAVAESLRKAGITVLINEGERVSINGASFWMAGVDDHMVGKTDMPSALKGSFPDEFKLLLAHNPIIFRKAARAGVDLTLSGHTHGGQVRVRDSDKRIVRRKRSAGLHKSRNSQIYITRGIGTVVLPVRYQCPPEISLLTLHCE